MTASPVSLADDKGGGRKREESGERREEGEEEEEEGLFRASGVNGGGGGLTHKSAAAMVRGDGQAVPQPCAGAASQEEGQGPLEPEQVRATGRIGGFAASL